MPAPRVRAARADDFDAWMPLWRGYQAFYKVDIADDVSGPGLGRKPIEQVYAQARARGCARVHWLTHETNTEAMKLYDRMADKPGFVQYRKSL